MTQTFTLVAEKRSPSRQENRSLQSQRRVLGVVYGHGVDSVPVSVDASDILRVYRKAGTSALVDLKIDGATKKVILKEVSLSPKEHEISHVDFFAVNLKEKSQVTVDLEFIGEGLAVKNGGILVINQKALDIKCLPADSPRNFEVDTENLVEIGDSITIKDLDLDYDKFELIGLEEDEIICSVVAPKKVEEETEETSEETSPEESKEERGEEKSE